MVPNADMEVLVLVTPGRAASVDARIGSWIHGFLLPKGGRLTADLSLNTDMDLSASSENR